MANECNNDLTVIGAPERLAAFRSAVAHEECLFSFEKIMPMPSILANLHCEPAQYFEDTRISPLTHWYCRRNDAGDILEERPLTAGEFAELAQLEHKSAFEWICANWGCQWAIADLSVYDSGDMLYYQFETPWTPPVGIVEALRLQFPDLEIIAKFDTPNDCEAGYY